MGCSHSSTLGGGDASSGDPVLLALDFDCTVLDANSDLEVQDLLDDGVPRELAGVKKEKGWTAYMQSIFSLLHSQGVGAEPMRRYLQRLPLAPGMAELLARARRCGQQRVELILISDANTVFIEWILQGKLLQTAVHHVYSNAAHFDPAGCVQLAPYHEQTECQISARNLCKGRVLTEHIAMRRKQGVKFSRVVYVGDGQNDLCPMLRLCKCDAACVRKGFRLSAMLHKAGKKTGIHSKLLLYDDAGDIAAELFDGDERLRAASLEAANEVVATGSCSTD